MKIRSFKLENNKSFPMRYNPNGWFVDSFEERKNSVVLIFKNGAQKMRRTFAKWYVTPVSRQGEMSWDMID